jgi:hypothetical protein
MEALALRAFPEPSRKCRPTGYESDPLTRVESVIESALILVEWPSGVRRLAVDPEGEEMSIPDAWPDVPDLGKR